jgi:hypothetical protein
VLSTLIEPPLPEKVTSYTAEFEEFAAVILIACAETGMEVSSSGARVSTIASNQDRRSCARTTDESGGRILEFMDKPAYRLVARGLTLPKLF